MSRPARAALLLLLIGAVAHAQSTPTTSGSTGGPFDHPLTTSTTTTPSSMTPPSTQAAPSSSPSAASSSPTALPVDASANWQVGVTLFEGVDLSRENDYLRESLPLLIFDGLSGIATHSYGPAERAAYQRRIVADALQAAELSLTDLQRKRSALFYESTTSAAAAAGASSPAGGGAPASGTQPSSTSPASSTAATSAAAASASPTTAASGATVATPSSGSSATPSTPTTAAAPPATSPSGAASPFASIDASIAAARQRIHYLKQLDAALVVIANEKPVVFVTSSGKGGGSAGATPSASTPSVSPAGAPPSSAGPGPAGAAPSSGATPSTAPGAPAASSAASTVGGGATGAGQLLPYPVVSPAAEAKKEGLDFLVTGKITEAEGYLIVEVSAYNADLGAPSYTFRTVVDPSEAFGALHAVISALATQVLGREWGTLRLSVEPSGALVYVDGRFYGVGNTELRFLRTGRHEIRVEAPGYGVERASIEIAPLATKDVKVGLKRSAANEIAIVSYPQGADVYLNSLWEGTTPLLVDRPFGPVSFILHRKDYLDYSGTLSPDSPPSTSIRLLPDLFKKSDFSNTLRDRFYASFGAFAVSVILPVAFYSLFQSYSTMYQESIPGSAEEARLKNLTVAWYYSLYGGLFISVSLFVNTVIDVIHYLGASD